MSAPKGKNGFVQGRIVSSQRPRRNIRGENKNDFNMQKIGGISDREWFRASNRRHPGEGRDP
jgi:hypothetical protein